MPFLATDGTGRRWHERLNTPDRNSFQKMFRSRAIMLAQLEPWPSKGFGTGNKKLMRTQVH
jgi:hypothetical protein